MKFSKKIKKLQTKKAKFENKLKKLSHTKAKLHSIITKKTTNGQSKAQVIEPVVDTTQAH